LSRRLDEHGNSVRFLFLLFLPQDDLAPNARQGADRADDLKRMRVVGLVR